MRDAGWGESPVVEWHEVPPGREGNRHQKAASWAQAASDLVEEICGLKDVFEHLCAESEIDRAIRHGPRIAVHVKGVLSSVAEALIRLGDVQALVTIRSRQECSIRLLAASNVEDVTGFKRQQRTEIPPDRCQLQVAHTADQAGIAQCGRAPRLRLAERQVAASHGASLLRACVIRRIA